MTSNLSFWEKSSFFNFDIIIIGSGIVGLTAAIRLKEMAPHLSIAILERGFLPSGASTKNAGFACFGSISELMEQEKIMGTDALFNLVEKRWKGLLKLRKRLGDNDINFQNNGSYELFKPAEQQLAEDCIEKIDYYNQLLKPILGNERVFSLKNEKIADFDFSEVEHLIFNQFEGQIDTGKMMKALLLKANAAGILLLNQCQLIKIQEEKNQVALETNQGLFSCSKVLLATNGFSQQFIPEVDLKPGRGQVLITKPIPNLKLKGIFHYEKGFYYFRNIGNRILLGGGRNLDFKGEETTEFGTTPKIQNHLESLLKEVILSRTPFEIEQRWSGIMAFGSQSSPIIKAVNSKVYCAIRGSGMGIAIGSQTGEDAAELVLEDFKGKR